MELHDSPSDDIGHLIPSFISASLRGLVQSVNGFATYCKARVASNAPGQDHVATVRDRRMDQTVGQTVRAIPARHPTHGVANHGFPTPFSSNSPRANSVPFTPRIPLSVRIRSPTRLALRECLQYAPNVAPRDLRWAHAGRVARAINPSVRILVNWKSFPLGPSCDILAQVSRADVRLQFMA